MLELMGPKAKQAVSALIKLLKDESGYVRAGAAGALRRMGPEAKQAVPALTESFKDANDRVRKSVAVTIEQLNSI